MSTSTGRTNGALRPGGKRLVVDAEVGMGELRVRHDRSDDDFGPGDRGRFGDDDEVEPSERGNAACAGGSESPMRSPDLPSLVAGIAMIALGTALLLDRLDTIDIRFATFAPIAFAAVGAILLALGLSRRA